MSDDLNEKLIEAIQGNNLSEVKHCIKKGANPNKEHQGDMRPLQWATYYGNSEIADVLLDAGANPDSLSDSGGTALHYAAFLGHTNVAKVLLAHNADPNLSDGFGNTPLMEASNRGYLESVKELLSFGVDSKKVNKKGNTALNLAKIGWSNSKTQEEAKEYRSIVQLLRTEAGKK